MADQVLVPPVQSGEEDTTLPCIYTPRRKSGFLTSMLRTLSATPESGLLFYGPGSLPHRTLEAVSIELERLSFDLAALARRAIREAAYRAFRDDALFPARFMATASTGQVLLTLPVSPLTSDLYIEAGDLLGTQDGRTVSVLTRTLLPAGQRQVLVPVISSTVGTAGAVSAGQISVYLAGRAAFTVTNPAAIAGGRDDETDDEIALRFQRYILGIQTGSEGSLISAGENAAVTVDDRLVRVISAAVVAPWRLPHLGGSAGYGFLVVDAGSGYAPQELVAQAQQNVNLRRSAMESVTVVSASSQYLQASVQLGLRAGADPVSVEVLAQKAWVNALANTRLEDGSGQGRVDVAVLKAALDAVPGVITTVLSLSGTVQPAVFCRLVPGVLSVTTYQDR